MSGRGVLGRQPHGVAGVPSQSGGSAGVWKLGWRGELALVWGPPCRVASSFAWPSTRLVLLPAAQDVRPGETRRLQLLPRRCRPSSAPHRHLRSASPPPLHGAQQPSLPGPGKPREGARALPGQCPRAPGVYQA